MNSNLSSNRTRVKICGITRVSDALQAVAAGADAIGLVFYDASPRAVDIERAAQICAALPPFVTVVALTVNASKGFIEQLLAALPIGLLQFHGDEDEAFCSGFDRPYMKAIRMRPELDLAVEFDRYHSASGILLDAYRKGVPGGTGERFDWGRIPSARPLPLILAGGLGPENIGAAVTQVRPFAVDVSGGVEAGHGVKDPQRVVEFINSVVSADGQMRV